MASHSAMHTNLTQSMQPCKHKRRQTNSDTARRESKNKKADDREDTNKKKGYATILHPPFSYLLRGKISIKS